MGAMTIEGLPPEVEAALAARAARNGRSVGEEARAILAEAVAPPEDLGKALHDFAMQYGGLELNVERDQTPAGSRAVFE